MTQQGEVYDIGYQRYLGPREGRWRARKALWANGVRLSLGLGRPLLAKVFPWGFMALAVAISGVAVIIASFTANFISDADAAGLWGYNDYYEVISYFLMIFAAVVAPELLCPDRRDGVLSLYLVRPITPTDYVAARFLAFLTIALCALYLGQIVLIVGYALSASEPVEYLRNNWLAVPRFMASGLALTLFAASISMAVASLTTRRAYAAAGVVGLFIVSTTAAGVLVGTSTNAWFNLLGILSTPIYLNSVIFGSEQAVFSPPLPTGVPELWYAAIVGGACFLLWLRYRRLAA